MRSPEERLNAEETLLSPGGEAYHDEEARDVG